jgi:serine/threonine protein kinase
MSFLYLGIHPKTSKLLVVKVLSPKYIKHKETVDRFLKEAHIIAMTNHPNIVKLYGEGKWEKGLYIAMEFIQGISLRQFILKKSLSKKRALEIILQVAYALCHLHAHGVIHRDLKPENILITETGEIKVIDFGIAQLNSEEKHVNTSEKKRLIGTPIYMSPEQKESPSNVDFSSDIFSLGIITYELVLGRLSHGIVQLSLLPKGLREIIGKALNVDLKQRYKDIVDFITDISQYIKMDRDEKEIEPEEKADDLIESLHQTQSILFSKKPPNWPHINVGIGCQKNISLTGLYIDFFHLTDNQYAIILAEPLKTGVATLLPTASFRGMVRSSVHEFYSSNKEQFHPTTMLQFLNQAIYDDSMRENFACSVLFLNKETDQLSFVSCGHNSLWHIAEGTQKITSLTTPNSFLGENINNSIVETTSNWHNNDKLLLFSFGMFSEHIENNNIKEEDLKKVITNNLIYSSKTQATKTLENVLLLSKQQIHERLAVVLSIQRFF